MQIFFSSYLTSLKLMMNIPREGIERSELLPTKAKLFCRISTESANISTNIRYSKEIELLDTNDWGTQAIPCGRIISEPMSSIVTSRWIRWPSTFQPSTVRDITTLTEATVHFWAYPTQISELHKKSSV